MRFITAFILILMLCACNLAYPQAISAPSTTTTSETISYWLVADAEENGETIRVGCDTYVQKFDSGVARSVSPAMNIRAGLNALFNSSVEGYHNHWSGFSVTNVVVDSGGTARIEIGGMFLTDGVCANPEISAQILLIVFAEPTVQTAFITVDGVNVAQAMDASGRSGANAVFTRDSIPYAG